MMVSCSMGVSRRSEACLRRRWLVLSISVRAVLAGVGCGVRRRSARPSLTGLPTGVLSVRPVRGGLAGVPCEFAPPPVPARVWSQCPAPRTSGSPGLLRSRSWAGLFPASVSALLPAVLPARLPARVLALIRCVACLCRSDPMGIQERAVDVFLCRGRGVFRFRCLVSVTRTQVPPAGHDADGDEGSGGAGRGGAGVVVLLVGSRKGGRDPGGLRDPAPFFVARRAPSPGCGGAVRPACQGGAGVVGDQVVVRRAQWVVTPGGCGMIRTSDQRQGGFLSSTCGTRRTVFGHYEPPPTPALSTERYSGSTGMNRMRAVRDLSRTC